MSIIKCKNLTIGYEDKKVLENVNFVLNEQDFLVVLGENGSGKTTFIKTLVNLLKPIKGKFDFNTIKLNEIGYLPQVNTSQKDFPASVYEIVISGCLNNKKILSFYNKKDKELAIRNLKRFKIEHLKNKNFSELSSGQKQKVLLARSMCALSKVLILDEPVTSLDQKSIKELYGILHQLNKEGITIVVISHDLEILKYSNKVLEVNNKTLTITHTKDFKGSDNLCHH